jgi:hypothetical protein
LKPDAELDPFIRLVEALEPWLGQIVVIGGWAHRLYRLDPRAQKLAYLPLTTLDCDVAVPTKVDVKKENIRERMLAAGFQEEFVGEDPPPATHYHLGGHGGFYAEFLTPLVGTEHGRGGKRKATREVGGISSQQLRYIDILMISPWKIALGRGNEFPFNPAKQAQIANPATFLAQKILIQGERDRKDRAKDILYIHDTIEAFSGNLAELRQTFATDIRSHLHRNRVRELTSAADVLFENVNDTIREAALMATGRKLTGETIIEMCRAGLKEIFARK